MLSSFTSGASRLAVGTVQFGLNYGIANTRGQVSREQAGEMLSIARAARIDTIDTAIAYGEAEDVLGHIGVSGFRIVSKVPSLPKIVDAADDWIEAQVEASLARLGVSRLNGLLLHAPDDLQGPSGSAIAQGMLRVRNAGLVERIGLSVYSPEQLARLINILPLEIIQIPINVLDRRFADTGWLDRMYNNGVEIHARSAFLQGLLLMSVDRIPSKFTQFLPPIKNWHNWLKNGAACISPVQACLAHVASYKSIARIVVGFDSLTQLQEITAAAEAPPRMAPESLSVSSSPLINPNQWNNL